MFYINKVTETIFSQNRKKKTAETAIKNNLKI
jgi:hypothetical protein